MRRNEAIIWFGEMRMEKPKTNESRLAARDPSTPVGMTKRVTQQTRRQENRLRRISLSGSLLSK